ncbi:MAG: hypothetical protein LBM74_02680 [Oscillospiraceae bacterium]|jgi:3-deoxy-7-phosphoheptulonate synthase|nr:hypothetical protein [Oscillospiraceae bacterium]
MGRHEKPVLLKRGLSATIAKWLMSAEHIMAAGADGVMLLVHPHPKAAQADGLQSLTPGVFEAVVRAGKKVRESSIM